MRSSCVASKLKLPMYSRCEPSLLLNHRMLNKLAPAAAAAAAVVGPAAVLLWSAACGLLRTNCDKSALLSLCMVCMDDRRRDQEGMDGGAQIVLRLSTDSKHNVY